MGFVTAIAVLAGFALPPLLQLSRVPALRGAAPRCRAATTAGAARLRPGDRGGARAGLLGGAGDAAVPVLHRRTVRVFVAALTGAGLLLVHLAGRLRGRVGVAWRFGVANLSRRRAESVVQLVAFGGGIMVLLLLGILRGDLEQRLAAHACRRISRTTSSSTFRPPSAAPSCSFLQGAGRAHHQGAADDPRAAHLDQRQAGGGCQGRARRR